jgi:hypothetical protein
VFNHEQKTLSSDVAYAIEDTHSRHLSALDVISEKKNSKKYIELMKDFTTKMKESQSK